VLRQWLGDNAETIIERMKPAIREWMDEHFPAMLEDAFARNSRLRSSCADAGDRTGCR